MTFAKSFAGQATRPALCRAPQPVKAVSRSRRSTVVTHAGFIGSPTNAIIVGSTIAFLVAGRFGIAPTVKYSATPGLQLVEDKSRAGVKTGDPAGFTIVDVLGHGTLGHGFGIGIVLGLRALGKL